MMDGKVRHQLCPYGHEEKIILSLQPRQCFGQRLKTLVSNLNVRGDKQNDRGVLRKSKDLSSDLTIPRGKYIRIQTVWNNRHREPVKKRMLRQIGCHPFIESDKMQPMRINA